MNKNRALAIGAGVVVVVLSWFAAFSNGLGSAGASAPAASPRPAPVVRAAQPMATSIDAASNTRRPQLRASFPAVIRANSASGSWASFNSGTSLSPKETNFASSDGNAGDNRLVAGGDD